MPWTESRSREEWLAEVQRRGTRIRRRRRVAFGVVGAFALVLPLSVTATVLRDGPERAVEVSVAGPAPAGGGDSPTTTFPIEPVGGGTAVAAATAEEPTPPAGAPSTTTTTEVHQRVAAVNGSTVEPAPPTSAPPASLPPADNPVVERPTTTLGPVGNPAAAAAAEPTTTVPLVNDKLLAVCAAEKLQIDVVPTKPAFSVGETARGVGFIQTARATDCLVPLPTSFRIEEVGTGKVLGSVPSSSEYPNPAKADGTMYTSNFSWDQKNCSGSTCTQVPPGLYQAVAEWRGGVPYRGWGEFRITA